MSRPLRFEFPGAWYHVMNRGRRREMIFQDAQDFKAFIDLMKSTSGKGKGSAIKRTEVKRNYSLGPENQVFSPRTKILDNTSNFFVFCPCLNISFSMSAYFAAPVSHQDLGRRSSPTVLRRPDNLRSHVMSKVLLQISWL